MKLKLCKNDGELDPPPAEIDITTGKKCWVIKDYKIWADSYEQALSLLSLIENC